MDPEDLELAARSCQACFSLAKSTLRRSQVVLNAVLSTAMATKKSSTITKYIFYRLKLVYSPSVPIPILLK